MRTLRTKTTHQNTEIIMSNLSMVISFKCSNCCKEVYDHLRLSFNASDALSLCRIGSLEKETLMFTVPLLLWLATTLTLERRQSIVLYIIIKYYNDVFYV